MFDGCHFNLKLLKEAFAIKEKHFGKDFVGVLVHRENPEVTHSYDPSILLAPFLNLNKIVKWVVVVSTHPNDTQNLKYVKHFTKIPCYTFATYEEFVSFHLQQ